MALDPDGEMLYGVRIRRIDSPDAPLLADLNGSEWEHIGWSKGIDQVPTPPADPGGQGVNGPDVEGVLAAHEGWDYGGPGMIECEGCGWKSERLGPEWNSRKEDRHRTHVAAALRAEVRAWLESEGSRVYDEINELLVSHDMWIGDDGEALDYLPEREARIADFMHRVDHALAALAEQVGQVASVGEGEGS
jgi:hypothetical protein